MIRDTLYAVRLRTRSPGYSLFVILLVATALSIRTTSIAAQEDPDALYRERANVARAKEAAEIWQARLTANPQDFESAWKLARATYWLGEQDAPNARRAWLERGVEAGRIAAKVQPQRPEGHFW